MDKEDLAYEYYYSYRSEGLMPDHDGYPVSRDWEEIDCSAVRCVYNLCKKCSVPSLAKIGEDGRCTGFRTQEPEKSSHYGNWKLPDREGNEV